jgi:prolyl-tRNA synthetase
MIKLGTQFSERMDCAYLNSEGKSQPTAVGSYEIEIGRLLACIVEQHHDNYGLIWPMSVAPYPLHFISLPS